MTCPRCQEAEASSERCPRCGVVVATYLAALEKMRRTRAPRPSAPAAALVPAAASGGVYALSFHGDAGTVSGVRCGDVLRRLLGLARFMTIAAVGAHRYRLSRTSWRGIRFSFRARTRDFVKLFIGGSMLTTLTLGLYYPVFDTRRRAFMVAHAHFGNRPFGFDG